MSCPLDGSPPTYRRWSAMAAGRRIAWSSTDRYSPVQDRVGVVDPADDELPPVLVRVNQHPSPYSPAWLDEREILRVTYQGDDRCNLRCPGCYTGERLDRPSIAPVTGNERRARAVGGLHRPPARTRCGTAGFLPSRRGADDGSRGVRGQAGVRGRGRADDHVHHQRRDLARPVSTGPSGKRSAPATSTRSSSAWTRSTPR